MNRFFFLWLLVLASAGCSNGQNTPEKTRLSAKEFAQRIAETGDVQLVDVRTPGEFKNGHLENALNVDISGSQFRSQASALDKQKPVFVYCLSGPRSTSAAAAMRKMGFEQVYEMPGGMMEWRVEGLPEVRMKTNTGGGMTLQQYDALLDSDKLVLVDFYAEWCAPCKKMKPYLERIAKELADKVTLVRIDADENTALCKKLDVATLPVLRLYKGNELVWENEGYIEEKNIRAQLK